MKELTMSIQQFNAYSRGEITIKEIKKNNVMDSVYKKIFIDKRLAGITTFLVANLIHCEKVSAASKDVLGPINEAGTMFLGIIQTVGYWLCLIMCLIEIIKAIMNGQSDKIGKIAIRYVCIFAGLYLMPWCFNLIRDIFGGM